MDYPALFGQRVRALRRKRGWSQDQLSERCGLHRTYIGSVERGERNISLTNIHLLAEALGVTPEELVSVTDVSSDPNS